MFSSVKKNFPYASNVGAFTRWAEVQQTYTLYADSNPTADDKKTNTPKILKEDSPTASYSWCNHFDGITGNNEIAASTTNHFCCDDGLALVQELVKRWQGAGFSFKEGVLTGLSDAIILGSSATIFVALTSSSVCYLSGGVYGLFFGFSAGLSKGVLYAAKQAAVSGFWGAANGAARGAFWGGNFVLGAVFGATIGTLSGVNQYYSLQAIKQMEDILIKSITTFSDFSTGKCTYTFAVGSLAVCDYKIKELVPDERIRAVLPTYRAFFELNAVLDNYARTKGWLG